MTTATVYVEPTPITIPDCNNMAFRTAVLDRHWVISPAINSTAIVKLPYKQLELDRLITESALSTSHFDDLSLQSELLLSKYSGLEGTSWTVDDDPNNNCIIGGTTIHNPDSFGSNPILQINHLYSTYSVPGFSEF